MEHQQCGSEAWGIFFARSAAGEAGVVGESRLLLENEPVVPPSRLGLRIRPC